MIEIQKLVINVKGKDYTILKPYPITIANIEKKAYVGGSFDIGRYEDGLLRLVSKDLKKEDLVKFTPTVVELDNGVVLTPCDISYKQYESMIKTFANDDMTTIVKNYFAICGNTVTKPEELTSDDIDNILDAYISLYDKTELNEVLDQLQSFR